KPLRAAATGDQAQLDLGLAQLRLIGADAYVAAQRELEPAAETEPLNRSHERRLRRVHPVPHGVERARRTSLGRAGVAQRRELLDAGAGHEGPLAAAPEHDRAGSLVAVEPIDLLRELLEQHRRELVHRWVVDRDERDGAVVLGVE